MLSCANNILQQTKLLCVVVCKLCTVQSNLCTVVSHILLQGNLLSCAKVLFSNAQTVFKCRSQKLSVK